MSAILPKKDYQQQNNETRVKKLTNGPRDVK
jgi:hypothetical protein